MMSETVGLGMDRYKAVIAQMLEQGHAYRCYTTPEELDALRERQRANNEKPRYDGRWRPAPGKTLPAPPAGVQPVIRFCNPVDGVVAWDDQVKGRIAIANEELDDLIIARADGTPTYNFCVCVDDWDMVAAKDRTQDVKRIVTELKARKRPEAENHRKVYRPWGYYDSIDAGPRFQVKRIVVNPGASLSLQMHHHRAEHWIVVSGTARVTCGDNVLLLSENQSTYIPLGTTHRLENPGKLPLEMIEVQSGSYLGEDDIVRFEDTYGRK